MFSKTPFINSVFRFQLRKTLLIFVLTAIGLGALYFSRTTSAVNRTWDNGGGADQSWSNPLNWSDDTVPGANDIAVFDSSSGNATIDAGFAGSVLGIQINSGYLGTITQGAGVALTVGTSGYTQTSGSFAGSDADLTVNGSFTLSGGTFNAPSATLSISSAITIVAPGSFNPGTGTVAFVGAQNTIVAPSPFTLNNVIVNKASGNALLFNSTSTIIVPGTLTLSRGFIQNNAGNGTIDARGPIAIDPNFGGGNSTLLISGNINPRTVILPVPAPGGGLPALTINAPNTIVTASGSGTITFAQPLDVQSVQSFTNDTVNFVFSNPFTFSGNFTPGSGDVTFNSSFTQTGGTFAPGAGQLNVNSSFTLSGGTFNAPNNTLSLTGAVSITAPATFNPGTGTVAFVGAQNTIVAPSPFTLNNVIVNKASGNALLFNSTSTIIVPGTLTLSRGFIQNNAGNGTIDARGPIAIDPNFGGGNSTLLISGNINPRTVILPVPASGGGLPALTINAPNTIVTASGSGTITFAQPLDVQSVQSFTNDTVNFVFSNPFTFSGNFTPGSGDVTFNSSFTQTGGTFMPGAGQLVFNSSFTVSGGTFNAPNSTLSLTGAVSITAPATFNPGTGTVAFVGAQNTIIVPNPFTLNNVIVNKAVGNALLFNSTTTIIVPGTLALSRGSILNNAGNGTIDARGPITIDPNFGGGNSTLLISGNINPRTVTLPVPAPGGGLPALTINAPNTIITASGSGTITFAQALDVQSVQSFTNGAVNFVFSNPFTFGGTTNFTPGSGDITFGSTFTQTGGTFTPGTGQLDFNSSFTLSGGTFNAPNSTLSLTGAVSITAPGTFNPGTGTVAFVGAQNTIIVPNPFTLNNCIVNKAAGNALLFNNTTTIIVPGSLTLSRGFIQNNAGNGTIDARGPITIDANFGGGNSTLLISGNISPRTVTLPVPAPGGGLPALTINAPNTVVTASGSGTITFAQPLDVQSVQSFTNAAVNFVFSNPFTFGGATNFTPGSGDITFGSTFTQTGGTFTPGTGQLNFNSSFTLSGGTFNAPNSTLSLTGAVSITAPATFNPGTGTVAFVGAQNTFVAPNPFTLNNCIVNKAAGNALLFNSTSTIIVPGTLTLSSGFIQNNTGNGTVDARGPITIDPNFGGGNSTLLISGNINPRTVTLPIPASGGGLPALTINAPNTIINATGAGTIAFAQPVGVQTVQTFTNDTVDFVFNNVFTFAGNFTPGSGAITFNSTFTQTGGVFTPGTSLINFNSNFTLSGGTFNAPDSTLSLTGALIVAAPTAATFNPGTGTVAFVGAQNTIVAPNPFTLNNVIINKSAGNALLFNSNTTIIVAGSLNLTRGSLLNNAGNGTMEARGNVTIASLFDGGNASMSFSGPANQSFTNNGGVLLSGPWTVNKSTGRVLLASNLTLATSQTLNITSGTLDLGPSFDLTAGPVTIGANGTLRDFGSGNLTLGSMLVNNGIFNFNGGGTGCADSVADAALIRSSQTGTQRNWSGTGTFSVVDVDVQDQDASAIAGGITAFTSTNSGNNTNWIFDPGCPVVITDPPDNQSVCPGAAASFSVTATGSGLTFQWRKNTINLSNGGNISGADTTQVTINPAGAGDPGSYDAVATNTFGVTATSAPATLSLLATPVVNQSPSNVTVCEGQPASFTVMASGDGLTFQWRKNGNPLSEGGRFTGVNTPLLTINPTVGGSGGDDGAYDVVVGGLCNPAALSAPASLTVNTRPAISTQPADQEACENSSVSFSVAASGTGLTFQWRKNGVPLTNNGNISGANTATLTINPVSAGDAANSAAGYDVVISGTCSPAVTSTRRALTVNSTPSITNQPSDQEVCDGTMASFAVQASGTNVTFQWRKNGVPLANGGNISGADTATLTINPVGPGDAAGSSNGYDVVVSGTCTPPATSSRRALTVDGFALSANSQTFTSAGGSGSVNVITGATCSWTAVSNDSFIQITSGSSGTGNGPVNFTVDSTTGQRSGTMTIAGQTFTVNQNGPVDVCTAAPPGMVAWWPGEGRAIDIRGDNNGVLENVSFSPGKVGRAFSFSGLRGVIVPDNPALNQQKFTIDAWFTLTPFTCPGGPGTCAAFIAAKSGTDGDSGYELDARENGVLNFFLNGGLGGESLSSIGTFADGAFHHVAATYDGATMKLYVDGALNNQKSIASTINYPAGTPFIIGGRELQGPTVQFPGLIDEPQFFARALDISEIQSIFTANTAGNCKPRCTPPPSGMVSWYTGDDNPFDSRGVNHGSLQNGTTFGSGKVGRAFSFNGNSEVSVPDNLSLDSQTFTIDAWVFPTVVDGFNDMIINKETSTDGQYEISIRGTAGPGQGSIPVGNLAFFITGINGQPNDQNGWVDGGGAVPLNAWSHIALSFDGSSAKAYVNGVLTRNLTGLSGTIPVTDGPFRIGSRDPSLLTGDPNAGFNGAIDEVEFFNRALSTSEIQALNNAGFAGKCKQCVQRPTGMISWWTGDANTNDETGNGNNGAFQGLQAGQNPFSLGKVSQSFNFDGVGNLVEAPPAPSLNPLNGVSIDAWVKPQTQTSTNDRLIAGRPGGYQLFVRSDGRMAFTVPVDGGLSTVNSVSLISTTSPTHVAGTYDGASGDQAIYVNGVLERLTNVDLSEPTLDSQNTPFDIGGFSGSGGSFFGGRIDEVELFSRPLNQNEIRSIVTAGASGKCKVDGTTTGSSITNQMGDVTVTLENVTTEGTTTYQTFDNYQDGPMPFGFINPLEIADISTTVSFSTASVCFNLQATEFSGAFRLLRVLHLEGNDLVNRTSSADPASKTLCANVTSLSPFVIVQSPLLPSAAGGEITGRITTAGGAGVSGAVVNLSGTQTRKTITDADGNYRFSNIETNGFYSLTPSRANFSFSPANRSFSQLAERTEAAFTASSVAETNNPLDTAEYFVRQQYVDLLGREPDEGGFNYWSNQILGCGDDAVCANARRRDVAAAFFIEAEFQRTGTFIYGLYKAGLARQPLYREFSVDRTQVIEGANLEVTKQRFAESFVERPEFASRYQDATSGESFVDALLRNVQASSGVDLGAQRGELIQKYNAQGSLVKSRATVVQSLTESAVFKQAEYNSAFVLTEYFGYLQRDPDPGGYTFWLDVLNNHEVGNYQGMVCAFTTSAEYQQRFSSVVSHSNRDCGR